MAAVGPDGGSNVYTPDVPDGPSDDAMVAISQKIYPEDPYCCNDSSAENRKYDWLCALLMGCLQPVLLGFVTCGSGNSIWLAVSCCLQERCVRSRAANDIMLVSLPAASHLMQPCEPPLPGMLYNGALTP